MKRYSILLFALLGFLFILNGCKEDTPEFGTPFSKLEGIADEWELIELKQADLLTKSNSKSIDLTSLYIGNTPATLNFSTDNSFTGDAGSSKLFFPTSGSWSFDDDLYPSKVIITSEGQTYSLNLLAPVRESVDPYLHVQYVRPFDGCAPAEPSTEGAVAYEYKFARK